MERLPMELVNIILEFHGYHSWRNGKYMRKLCLTDEKYKDLKTLPSIQKDEDNNFKVIWKKMRLTGTLVRYEIKTSIYNQHIHWYFDTYTYYSKHRGKKSWSKPQVTTLHYVFGHNEKQHLPMIQR
jgi:hypothetical protein